MGLRGHGHDQGVMGHVFAGTQEKCQSDTYSGSPRGQVGKKRYSFQDESVPGISGRISGSWSVSLSVDPRKERARAPSCLPA